MGSGHSGDARAALLGGLIDHAPTFPPAELDARAALREDARAGESESAFILGRLVWRASRLDELSGCERPLSLVLDWPLPQDERVEAVEMRRPDDPRALAGMAPEAYVELPTDDRLESELRALAAHGLRAKVRCGGAATPSVADLARFVAGCRATGVVFKATAGLHHAVRRGSEHGLLNLLAACVFGVEEEALAEEDAGAFALDASSLRWRGREAGPDELARVRAGLFHSVGSCSFFEPVEELGALGILPLEPAVLA